MKTIHRIATLSCVMAATLMLHAASAQTTTESTTTTTTNSAGTVTQVSPDVIMVTRVAPAGSATTTTTVSSPVSYSYTKTTTYVDEMGQPVSIETVKSGLPVTVYYTKVGDKMVASKVVVRKATVVTPAVPVAPVVEKKTSTTTTTTE